MDINAIAWISIATILILIPVIIKLIKFINRNKEEKTKKKGTKHLVEIAETFREKEKW